MAGDHTTDAVDALSRGALELFLIEANLGEFGREALEKDFDISGLRGIGRRGPPRLV